jgi:excisionase family DNA binding protein
MDQTSFAAAPRAQRVQSHPGSTIGAGRILLPHKPDMPALPALHRALPVPTSGGAVPGTTKHKTMSTTIQTHEQLAPALLTKQQVMKLLGVSASWLMRHQELPRVRVGRHLRWKRSDVQEYIDQQTHGGRS